jgi:lipoate-protein ligase A
MNDIIKFEDWKPEVYRVPIEKFSKAIEDAILYEKYGIYIPYGDTIWVHHGDGDIDYDVCKELNVYVIELGYHGGNTLCSNKDFPILIISPSVIGLTHEFIAGKICEILSKYISNVTIDNNDILVDGKKISGAMQKQVLKSSVWAAQFCFTDYSDIIEQVCLKPAVKKPGHIVSTLLTRDLLEKEILAWLRKEEIEEGLANE